MQNLHKHRQLQFRKVNAFLEKFETHFGKMQRKHQNYTRFSSPLQPCQLMRSKSEDEDAEGL